MTAGNGVRPGGDPGRGSEGRGFWSRSGGVEGGRRIHTRRRVCWPRSAKKGGARRSRPELQVVGAPAAASKTARRSQTRSKEVKAPLAACPGAACKAPPKPSGPDGQDQSGGRVCLRNRSPICRRAPMACMGRGSAEAAVRASGGDDATEALPVCPPPLFIWATDSLRRPRRAAVAAAADAAAPLRAPGCDSDLDVAGPFLENRGSRA